MKNLTSHFIFTTGLLMGFFSLHFLLDSNSIKGTRGHFVKHDHHHAVKNQTPVDKSNGTIRILCWIMTMPKYLETRTPARESDLGETLRPSSVHELQIHRFPHRGAECERGEGKPVLENHQSVPVPPQHHMHDMDWFLKADDDTFVVLENLRHTLSRFDTEKPWYLGRRFAPFIKKGYMSGGAGYVLVKKL
ncbi:Glycoprotein-N-acetylgalactosamine 3-beta-galactosyltransferase 1 [Dissostichus eleginoides]|uniref:Glycoprotein-N-acetylgalactosamine 3-beta-galactosyltransferase 1 n=1 Tax=Dissostichus eleginoides TaxID=100907 RepID=A0AAD9BDG6_DISEL|nr:Glycoprotein-N-acetylgalactosamine 3-beta-galactosyltransferase 1 [Dissostichus eleginoides]